MNIKDAAEKYVKDNGFDPGFVSGVMWASKRIKNELAQPQQRKRDICPHATVKWSVCSCNIVESVCPNMDDCDGNGTYSVPGNDGFGYSYQCNKFPGKLK